VCAGNFAKGEFSDDVFNGVTKTFVFPAFGGIEPFLAKARESGVKQLVVLSSLAVAAEHQRDIGSVSYVHHLAIEEAVKSSGLPATILRPGTFANNLLFWAATIKQAGAVYGPYPLSSQAPIHEADVAAVAAAALTQDGHANKTYAMTGPQSLTKLQQLDAIGNALGKKLAFHETSPEAFRQSMKTYMPEPVIKMLLDYWSDTVEQPDVVRPTVQAITGKPGRTLAQWAKEHVKDFQ
jgi:uncharacterized protein YbjT (DUF2867 family)